VFDQTLLGSPPFDVPVLKRNHLATSLLVGALAWGVAFLGLPIFWGRPETTVLAVESTVAGIGLALFALMLCYLHADTRRLGLRTWLWMGLTLVFNLAGFFAYLLYSAAKTGNWRRATVPAAYCFEVLIVGGLVLMPLIFTQALPKLGTTILIPPPPPPPAAPRATPKAPRPPTYIDPRGAHPVIPNTIAKINEELATRPPASVGGPLQSAEIGAPNGLLNSLGPVISVPPPPPVQAPRSVRVKVVGGQVEPPRLIYQPQPEYPKIALMTRTQGVVRLEATIRTDGRVEGLKVVSGHPLLVKAALEAVSRWRYQPTLLNGEPVEVVMELEVNFKLGGL
jgi:periplasmic protein TonB